MTHRIGWRDNFAIDNIVGHIQHTAQERLITGDALCLESFTAISHGFGLDDKTAFGANRDNDRVFDHLRFD